MKVAIIDDNREFLMAARRWLIAEGFEVLTLGNEVGRITSQVKTFQPDVVIVDLEMPMLNGRDLLKLLKSNYKARYIILSGKDASEIRKAEIETGADLALPKGDWKQLTSGIRTFEGRPLP